jgi:hypothetical protein
MKGWVKPDEVMDDPNIDLSLDFSNEVNEMNETITP